MEAQHQLTRYSSSELLTMQLLRLFKGCLMIGQSIFGHWAVFYFRFTQDYHLFTTNKEYKRTVR